MLNYIYSSQGGSRCRDLFLLACWLDLSEVSKSVDASLVSVEVNNAGLKHIAEMEQPSNDFKGLVISVYSLF